MDWVPGLDWSVCRSLPSPVSSPVQVLHEMNLSCGSNEFLLRHLWLSRFCMLVGSLLLCSRGHNNLVQRVRIDEGALAQLCQFNSLSSQYSPFSHTLFKYSLGPLISPELSTFCGSCACCSRLLLLVLLTGVVSYLPPSLNLQSPLSSCVLSLLQGR